MKNRVIPVILCGGSGTRLWPISRESMPKQFLNLLGEKSLLQETALRSVEVSGAKAEELVLVTLANSKTEVAKQMESLDMKMASHILCEPAARNTAAAIAFAAHYVADHFGNDCLLWVVPSDHYIGNAAALKAALEKAVDAAMQDYLVTFGITPSRPETGYGYVAMGATTTIDGVLHAKRFVEKPNTQTAQTYLASGEYLWNSGMFVFKAETVLNAFGTHASDINQKVRQAMFAAGNQHLKTPHMEVYQTIAKDPFDIAIMEKAAHVAVVPCDPAWSDIGSWQSLWEIDSKDANGNVVKGDVALHGVENCYVQSNERLVACAGVKDIVVIETADAVLVADKNNSDGLKAVVTTLKNQKRRETEQQTQENRPWGMFKVLSDAAGYKIKEIIVKPGERLSLQMHHHRAEFWVVIEGEAVVTVGDEEKRLKPQDFVFIPLQATHRLANPGKVDLKIIEVQCGNYLGEDDIVRFEDVYGRAVA